MKQGIIDIVARIEADGERIAYSLVDGNRSTSYAYDGDMWIVGRDKDGELALLRNSSDGVNLYVRNDVVLK